MKKDTMENNDKLIKDLLKEGFLTETPRGFTESVMNTLAEKEESKVKLPVSLTYFFLLAGSLAIAGGSLYFTNRGLLVHYYNELITFFSSVFVSSFHVVRNSFSFISSAQFGFFAGILIIIGLLLLLDRLAFSKRREMNLFI